MADCTESTEESNGPRPPIILKFYAPEEASENSANDEAEGQSGEDSSQTPSSPSSNSAIKIHSPVLTASKFGNSFGISEFSKSSSSSVLKPSRLLRPSQLTPLAINSPSTSLTPTVPSDTSNPFTKVTDSALSDENGEEVKKSSENATDTNNQTKKTEEPLKFLPLGTNSKDHHENNVNCTVTASSTSSFVFGQNLKDRVTVASENDGGDAENEEQETSKEKSNENGSSEMLFSSAAAVCRTTSRPGLTLTQAAQEVEEANRANKRKYSQVTPLTGEEGETNVLQINCKLFAFDKVTSGWQERGRGILRLNDRDDESRLVGRATGTQRLILNTKIWPGMTAELAGPKSLRLTAMDVHGDIRIFIVQAAPKEVDQLHHLLTQRLKRAKERQPKKLATEH
ncbi:ran-binding protein 3 [Fopius arisanus]|uniref:Ran-binding protein 3 n=1 Tax=Fopius arisanus TaxID=64838 RepID=A0A9R1T2A1_9HYME|nr:PREDICTED: ran-binding protein 3 [Fopius arisanus]